MLGNYKFNYKRLIKFVVKVITQISLRFLFIALLINAITKDFDLLVVFINKSFAITLIIVPLVLIGEYIMYKKFEGTDKALDNIYDRFYDYEGVE